MMSVGRMAVNKDGPVGGAWSEGCGFVPKNFERLLMALLPGVVSLKPPGDIVVVQGLLHHGKGTVAKSIIRPIRPGCRRPRWNPKYGIHSAGCWLGRLVLFLHQGVSPPHASSVSVNHPLKASQDRGPRLDPLPHNQILLGTKYFLDRALYFLPSLCL